MSLTLQVVDPTDGAALERFIRLPDHLMRDDPLWIAALWMERREALSPRHNPFFQHADVRFWLATRDGRDVGRISAQVDHLQREPIGHFGLIAAEDDPEVFAALTAAAEGWLRDRGLGEVQGPFSLSVNEEVGLLVDGRTRPAMVMMGHDPPYAAARLEALGYAKVKDVHAWLFRTSDDMPPAARERLDRGLPPGVTLRVVNMKAFDADVRLMADIVNDAWSSNWGFVAWTEAETLHLAKSLKPLLDTRLVRFVEVDGVAAGFIVALPDVNEAIRGLKGRLLPFGWATLLWRLKVKGLKGARVPLMGVRKAYARRPGGALLPFLLMDTVIKAGREAGYRDVEASWILEDNRPMRHILQGIGATPDKTYRIYGKAL